MKKITLFSCALMAAGSLLAQSQFKWYGNQEQQIWDYATPNWLDPAFPMPLPKTFIEGATAIFDDTSMEGSDTLKITGTISVADLKVNASKTYVIRRTADTDELTGTGALIKEGTGILALDIKNTLPGGTIVKGGKLSVERQNSPDVFGGKLKFEGDGVISMKFAGAGSSAYAVSNVPMEIPEGVTASIEMPRYSTFYSKIKGAGTLSILGAGERVHMGYTSLPAGAETTMPDLSEFTGTVKVEKLNQGSGPGFWGLILSTNRTFKDSLDGFNIDSTLYNKRVVLGSGAVLASHSGVRAYAIGELTSEDNTTVLCGYRSASNSPRVYYFVGGLNTDVVYPGQIAQAPGITSNYTHVSFVKMGTGTYTLTHPNNNMIGGLIVRQGTVLINDPVLPGNYTGGVGNFVNVETNGILGGTGRIQGHVDVMGTLKPGSNGVGTLSIRDSLSVLEDGVGGIRLYNLSFRSGSVAEFEINSASAYDKVVASGVVRFYNDEENVVAKPKIKIVLGAADFNIVDGDRFEIVSAKSVHESSQEFEIEYPSVNGVTWSHEVVSVATEEENSYKIVIKAQGSAANLKSTVVNSVSVFPNPSQGVVNFKAPNAEISSVEIYNVQGQSVYSQIVRSNEAILYLTELPTGLYYAKVNTDKGSETHKLMLK